MSTGGPTVLEPDVDRGPIITATLWSLAGTATLLQIARLWSRLHLKKLGWDDHWMFFTTALLAAFAAIIQVDMNLGGGRHAYHLAKDGVERGVQTAKFSWLSHPPAVLAIGTGKVSVGLLILRFLCASQKWMRWTVWTVTVTVNVVLVVDNFMTFLQCTPTERLWDVRVAGTCWDPMVQMRYSVFSGTISAAADVFLALVPLSILWRLQVKRSKKIGLCVIFSLGVLAGACGFYKSSKIPGLASRGDPTWDQFELLIFTGLEVWLIIFCGSIPTLAPLWDAVFGRDRKNTDYYSSNGSSKLSESSGEEVFQSRTNHNPYFSRFTEKNIVVSQTLDIESSSKRTIV